MDSFVLVNRPLHHCRNLVATCQSVKYVHAPGARIPEERSRNIRPGSRASPHADPLAEMETMRQDRFRAGRAVRTLEPAYIDGESFQGGFFCAPGRHAVGFCERPLRIQDQSAESKSEASITCDSSSPFVEAQICFGDPPPRADYAILRPIVRLLNLMHESIQKRSLTQYP